MSVMIVLEKCDEKVVQYAELFVRTIIDVEAKRPRKLRGRRRDSNQRIVGEQNIYWNTNMYVQGAQGK